MEFKFILFLMSCLGYVYNMSDNKDDKIISYIIWLFSNMGWATYFGYIGDMIPALMFAVYNCFCVYAIIKHSK